MKKLIEVVVPVSADEKYCDPRECNFNYFSNCTLFEQFLELTDKPAKYKKCEQCLNARTKDEPIKWQPDGAGSFRRSE